MDRNQTEEFYPILQAYAEGKTIETRRKPTTDNNGVTKDGWYEFNDWGEEDYDNIYDDYIRLPRGYIKKLIGRELSWSDEPVELRE